MRTNLRKHGTLLARILVGGFFFISGVQMAMSGAGYVESFIGGELGIPFAAGLAWLIVFVKIVGGAGILLGWNFDLSVLAIGTFVLLTVIFVHASFDDINLFKNLSIIGALLYMLAYGPGDGWRLGKKS